jgi:DNA-directed RNA polymerase specialized sigma24 family protein
MNSDNNGRIMTPKQFLRQYQNALHRERALVESIEELKERAMSVKSQLGGEGMPTSKGAWDKMQLVDRAIDKETSQLCAALLRSQEIREKVQTSINAVKDGRYRELLTLRYIRCRSWERIADDMHCDCRTVYKWHDVALTMIKVPKME